MTKILEAGQIVNIYNRTIPTSTNPEGKIFLEGQAKLLRLIDRSQTPQLWDVEFLEEPENTYKRFVFAEDIVKK